MSNVNVSEALKKMWYASTAKRPDVIAEKEKEVWIIEVAAAPYLRAVGQCLSYKFLWEEDQKINKPAKAVLLCYYLDSDLEKVLKHYGVMIVKMEPPTKT